MKNDKGVTLVFLVTTIIIMFIIAAVTGIASMRTYYDMQFETFKAKLEEVQKKVNEISEDYGLYTKTNNSASYADYFKSKFSGSAPDLLKNNLAKVTDVLNSNSTLNTNKESDFVLYFTENDVKKYLGLKGIDEIIIDFSTREVYSVNGCKDPENRDIIYYCSRDYNENTNVSEYKDINNSTLSAEQTTLLTTKVKKVVGSTTMYQITLEVQNRPIDGTYYPLSKAFYSTDKGTTWIEVDSAKILGDKVEFVLYEAGIYQFKLVDSSNSFKTSNNIRLD
ncbi:MAG: hypothetical protein HFJ45_03035 [Clostridia bacterium]|nr:hypothetical protein [Clostridia bacterium]